MHKNNIIKNALLTGIILTLHFLTVKNIVIAEAKNDFKLEYREKNKTTREIKTVSNFNNTGSCSQNQPYITCTESDGGSYGTRYNITSVSEWSEWSDWNVCQSNSCPASNANKQVETRKLFPVIINDDGGTIEGNVNKFYGLPGTKKIIPNSNKEGYIFNGYLIDNNILENNEVTFKEDTTVLKAQYTVKEYTVIFLDKDDNEIKKEIVKHNQNATPPKLEDIYGYVFVDWNNNFNNITNDLTLKPVYKEKEWNVTFLDQKGNTIEVIKVKHNQKAVEPKVPEIYGYIFAGWDKDINNITEDLQVKALYNIDDGVPRFTVNYKVDGVNRDYGSLVENNSTSYFIAKNNIINKTILKDTLPSITNCTKCKFSGYYIEDKLINPEDYVITKNETISLKFYSDINNNNIDDSTETINITFDSMGGSKIDSQKISLNSRINELKAPTKDNYNFAGWYTSSSYTNKWNLSDRATQDTVLYAKWDIKPKENETTPNPTPEIKPIQSIEVDNYTKKTISNDYRGLNNKQIITNSSEKIEKVSNIIEETKFNNKLKNKFLTIKFIENYDDVKLEKSFNYSDTLRIFFDEENYQEYSVRQSGVIKLPNIEKENSTSQFQKWEYKYNDVWNTYEIRPIYKEKIIEVEQVHNKSIKNDLFSIRNIVIVLGFSVISAIIIAIILNKTLIKGERNV